MNLPTGWVLFFAYTPKYKQPPLPATGRELELLQRMYCNYFLAKVTVSGSACKNSCDWAGWVWATTRPCRSE